MKRIESGKREVSEVTVVTMPAGTPRTSFEDAPAWQAAYVKRDESGKLIVVVFDEPEKPA